MQFLLKRRELGVPFLRSRPGVTMPRTGIGQNLYARMRLLIVGIIVPLLVISGALAYGAYRASAKQVGEGILQTARSSSASVDAELKGYVRALQVLASSPHLLAGDLNAFREEASRLVRQLGGPGAVVVVSNRDGDILLSTANPVAAPAARRANLAVVKAVFETSRPQISDMYITAVTRTLAFTIDVPVLRDGEVIYDLAFNPSRDSFFNIIRNLGLPEGWVIAILDTKFHHVARAPALGANALTRASESLRAVVADQPEGIAGTTSVESEPLLTAYARSKETGWSVAIGVPKAALSPTLVRSLALTLAVGLCLYALALGFAHRLVRGITAAEEERELLMHELNHRVKNSLVAVQAILAQSLRAETDPSAMKRAVQNRILALSRAHDILSQSNWASASLKDLLMSILDPYDERIDPPRFRFSGGPVRLPPRVALPFALIVNELATNALKYGALSVAGGAVRIEWVHAAGVLTLVWTEAGSPARRSAARVGFGTTYVDRAISYELDGTVERVYGENGLCVTLRLPLN